MKKLPNDIESLKEIIKELSEKLKHLEKENAKLRGRLGLNSCGRTFTDKHETIQSRQVTCCGVKQ